MWRIDELHPRGSSRILTFPLLTLPQSASNTLEDSEHQRAISGSL